jgi:hypothetical protein
VLAAAAVAVPLSFVYRLNSGLRHITISRAVEVIDDRNNHLTAANPVSVDGAQRAAVGTEAAGRARRPSRGAHRSHGVVTREDFLVLDAKSPYKGVTRDSRAPTSPSRVIVVERPSRTEGVLLYVGSDRRIARGSPRHSRPQPTKVQRRTGRLFRSRSPAVGGKAHTDDDLTASNPSAIPRRLSPPSSTR